MKQPRLGTRRWIEANPGRYAIYYYGLMRKWRVRLDGQLIDTTDTLAEAIDAAYAHAEAEALKVPTC